MRGRSKRDAVKELFWRKAIARFAASGLSKGKFCKQEGLSADLLRYWTETIIKRDGEQGHSVKPLQEKVAGKAFLPVVVTEPKVNDRVAGTQQMLVAEIVVAEGSVRLFNGITADTIRALWLALREELK